MTDFATHRADFPLLRAYKDLVYLDSAATSQKPDCVLEALSNFYTHANANPLRGLYDLSHKATEAYEQARATVADFLGAAQPEEIIFTRNSSESLNLISYTWAQQNLHPGDEIILTILEHHSNLLPWQRVARETGAQLRYLFCAPDGSLSEAEFQAMLSERTKLVCMTQLSNALGRQVPIARFVKLAHAVGAVFVCDGAQSVPHIPVDVQALDTDFLVFSGHKICGPMGIGVLYGKKALLEAMPPFLYGGEMIDQVSLYDASFAPLPHKFEAGTVCAADAVGLAAALQYVQAMGIDEIARWEGQLSAYCMQRLSALPHVHVLGASEACEHHGIFSFTLDGVHPHDISAILNEDHICIRAGQHCAQPLLQHLGVSSTARVSLAFYNTMEDIDRLADSLAQVRRKMGYGSESLLQ